MSQNFKEFFSAKSFGVSEKQHQSLSQIFSQNIDQLEILNHFFHRRNIQKIETQEQKQTKKVKKNTQRSSFICFKIKYVKLVQKTNILQDFRQAILLKNTEKIQEKFIFYENSFLTKQSITQNDLQEQLLKYFNLNKDQTDTYTLVLNDCKEIDFELIKDQKTILLTFIKKEDLEDYQQYIQDEKYKSSNQFKKSKQDSHDVSKDLNQYSKFEKIFGKLRDDNLQTENNQSQKSRKFKIILFLEIFIFVFSLLSLFTFFQGNNNDLQKNWEYKILQNCVYDEQYDLKCILNYLNSKHFSQNLEVYDLFLQSYVIVRIRKYQKNTCKFQNNQVEQSSFCIIKNSIDTQAFVDDKKQIWLEYTNDDKSNAQNSYYEKSETEGLYLFIDHSNEVEQIRNQLLINDESFIDQFVESVAIYFNVQYYSKIIQFNMQMQNNLIGVLDNVKIETDIYEKETYKNNKKKGIFLVFLNIFCIFKISILFYVFLNLKKKDLHIFNIDIKVILQIIFIILYILQLKYFLQDIYLYLVEKNNHPDYHEDIVFANYYRDIQARNRFFFILKLMCITQFLCIVFMKQHSKKFEKQQICFQVQGILCFFVTFVFIIFTCFTFYVFDQTTNTKDSIIKDMYHNFIEISQQKIDKSKNTHCNTFYCSIILTFYFMFVGWRYIFFYIEMNNQRIEDLKHDNIRKNLIEKQKFQFQVNYKNYYKYLLILIQIKLTQFQQCKISIIISWK